MTNPPSQRASQKHYIHSAVRLPPELNEEIKAAAKRNGHSMNAEIITRLQESPVEAIMARLDRLERMLHLILDQK